MQAISQISLYISLPWLVKVESFDSMSFWVRTRSAFLVSACVLSIPWRPEAQVLNIHNLNWICLYHNEIWWNMGREYSMHLTVFISCSWKTLFQNLTQTQSAQTHTHTHPSLTQKPLPFPLWHKSHYSTPITFSIYDKVIQWWNIIDFLRMLSTNKTIDPINFNRRHQVRVHGAGE